VAACQPEFDPFEERRDDGLRDKGDRALARVAERQVWLLAGQSSISSGSEFLVRVSRG
jgi:hypothetical protein